MNVEDREGWLWPVGDQGCWDWTQREADLPQTIMRHVTKFDICIHAGANAGFYAKQYAARFGRVLAFEPHPVNFYCLAQNVPELNVLKIQAALSMDRDWITLWNEFDERNSGGWQVRPGGDYPTLRIDDFVGNVGLIHLDVEGHEWLALEGARRVLKQHRPTVALETIRPPEDRQAVEILSEYGYTVAEKLRHDTIFTCPATTSS